MSIHGPETFRTSDDALAAARDAYHRYGEPVYVYQAPDWQGREQYGYSTESYVFTGDRFVQAVGLALGCGHAWSTFTYHACVMPEGHEGRHECSCGRTHVDGR